MSQIRILHPRRAAVTADLDLRTPAGRRLPF
jgi:hypothetical protein